MLSLDLNYDEMAMLLEVMTLSVDMANDFEDNEWLDPEELTKLYDSLLSQNDGEIDALSSWYLQAM